MGSGNLYARPANTKKNVKGSRLVRSFLFAGLLLLGMPFVTKAQPVFVHGASQTITVCQSSAYDSLGEALTISDPSYGVTETWTVVSGPSNGTLSGFPFSSASDGGVLTTAGANPTYTPNSGYFTDVIIIQDSNANGQITQTVINIVVTPSPSMIVGAVPAVCAGTTTTTLSYSALANVGPTSVTFTSNDSFIVPPGVNSINFDIQGAAGGGDSYSGAPNPGYGGRVQGTLAVTPGHLLDLFIGGVGANGSPSGALGGANGGGNAHFYSSGCGGAGGGATDIRLDGSTLASRVAVAGGGGGNGWDMPGPFAGGNGGNLVGGSSANNVSGSHAGGGNTTLSSGGAQATYVGWTPGQNGALGIGGDGSTQGISGGGGGGYYGGGGGIWTGGGGGSSYASPSLVTAPVFTSGYNIGAGIASFNYVIPGSYNITWDGPAGFYGFVPVTGAVLPTSPITINVPASAPPNTYNGWIQIFNNVGCGSSLYPFTVTIYPIPNVNTPLNQTICNSDTAATIFFTGAVPSTTFNWTNDHPGIGLAANGAGDIPSFNTVNSTPNPVTALITVTPLANGCSGSPVSFTMLVNPTPTLNSTLTPPAMCDSTLFNYTPTSLTTGTTFFWSRADVYGIIDSPASGTGNPMELLYNNTSSPVSVDYIYSLDANGCFYSQTVTTTVYPEPQLSTTLSPAAICDNTVFNYAPASATSGTTFTWNRNTVAGISNLPATGANNPLETLHNTTPDSVVVPYQFQLGANGCTYNQTVNVTVYPSPVLTTTLTPLPVCDSQVFSYVANSVTPGVSYAWNRPFVSGISNSAASATSNTISEYLVNTTANPVNVTYNYTLTTYGSCTSHASVIETIKPRPQLSSALTPSVCDSTVFNYAPTSNTATTSFSWVRDTVTGISNAAQTGSGNPMETLVNTTTHTVVDTYYYSMMANGCVGTEKVMLTVNPRPKLSSTLTPSALCDSAVFDYTPLSNTAGATFSWFRPYISGIYAVAQTGNGNPNQQLINSTYVPVDVAYTYTITANGCHNTQTVNVEVNPTPKLNPPYTATVCSGSPFNYTPSSYTPGALYSWNRPAVANITPGATFGVTNSNGVIGETLVDQVLVPQTVTYIYRLSINGCTNLGTQNLRVTVNPAPQIPQIVIYPDNFTPCNQTMFQNFGAGPLQASNVNYHWSATNATIFSEGQNNQNVLVNFDHPGEAVISVNSNVNGYGCVISNSLTYNVGSEASANPQVIYYNGQFICLTSVNSSYQWGYDDATTLDSTMLVGEIDQSYTNASPDFTDNHYWCMTTQNGCLQKSYYNAPSGVTQIQAGTTDMKVFPNPTSQILNVEINSSVVGQLNVEILDMLGQKVAAQPLSYHKASIDVASLPAGAYLVDCYREGVKIATTRFIKN